MKIVVSPSALKGSIDIPGSKSHTIRAVAIATMANGSSVLHEALDSADTRSALNAAEKFGAKITKNSNDIYIDSPGVKHIPEDTLIDVGNSGTTLRIFSALAALSNTAVRFDGDNSIRQRVMTNLFSSLEKIGAQIRSENQKCPFTIQGPISGGKTIVDGISSQFLTALLFATPLAKENTVIEVVNLHEKPYVHITLDWLDKQGIRYERKGLDWFRVFGGQNYKPFNERIAADFSSATFAVCAAAITQSELLIRGLDFNDHQGDKAVFDYLALMGLQISHTSEGVLVKGGNLRGVEIDMNDTPDALPAMAVAACFAEGKTSLLNVKQARIKECDRIAAMTTELRKMGADIEELPEGMIIQGSKLKGCETHGYHDHRVVMALSLAGMGASGQTIIDTAEAIDVTYPSFVNDYSNLGARFNLIS